LELKFFRQDGFGLVEGVFTVKFHLDLEPPVFYTTKDGGALAVELFFFRGLE
jgi:hypothetical protein